MRKGSGRGLGNVKRPWVVNYRLGITIVIAQSSTIAVKTARRILGDCAGPFEVRKKNREQEVVWARAMGVGNLEDEDERP